MPVAVTSISPRPRVTVVLAWTMVVRSANATSTPWAVGITVADLPTGWLSPVRVDSSTSRFVAVARRPSAGTRSPASSSTTSPGTTLVDASSVTAPLRRTRAVGTMRLRRASRAASAFRSWMKPTVALMITTTSTTAGVLTSRDTTRATAAATSRMMIRRSANWAAKRRHAGTRATAASSLGPISARRRAASASVRPVAGSTSRSAATAPASVVHGVMVCSAVMGSTLAPRVGFSNQRVIPRHPGVGGVEVHLGFG